MIQINFIQNKLYWFHAKYACQIQIINRILLKILPVE